MKWLHIYDINNVHIAINLDNVCMVVDSCVTESDATLAFYFNGNDTPVKIQAILDTYIQIMESIGGDFDLT